jgi:hypothetical protein
MTMARNHVTTVRETSSEFSRDIDTVCPGETQAAGKTPV